MHVMPLHAHHAEQWSSHLPSHNPVAVQANTLADIRPHPVPARLKKMNPVHP